MPNYATVSEGNAYVLEFKLSIDRDAWTSADPVDQQVALTMATRSIDSLNFAGLKADSTQANQFPRVAEGNTVGDTETPSADTSVPLKIKQACIEIALAFLDDVRIDIEIENLRVKGYKYSDASATYSDAGVTAHLAAGIPSNTAWRLLLPFLADARGIKLSRV